MGELINGKTPEQVKRILKWISFGCGNLDCDYCQYNDICSPQNGRDDIVARDALSLIECLEAAQPKWISVEERLPKPFVSVLVQMPGEEPHPTVKEGYISNEGVWVGGHFRREPDEVTHWMPFPEPPKE